MTTILTDTEIRIVGSLMEKALSTPDYYPLSLNALTNACNQKSNRDPVVAYDESDVQTVLDELEEKNIVNQSRVGRVPKYEELFSQKHNLVPREVAVLCVLMLRGPQTAGEIRGRTGRSMRFRETWRRSAKRLPSWVNGNLFNVRHVFPAARNHATRICWGTCRSRPLNRNRTAPAMPIAGHKWNRSNSLQIEVGRLRDDFLELQQAFQAFKNSSNRPLPIFSLACLSVHCCTHLNPSADCTDSLPRRIP